MEIFDRYCSLNFQSFDIRIAYSMLNLLHNAFSYLIENFVFKQRKICKDDDVC